MATATQGAEDAARTAGLGEVSLGQKMLSAVSGSVLTSLLGMYARPHTLPNQTRQKLGLVVVQSSHGTDVNSDTPRCRPGTATITRNRSERLVLTAARLQWRHTHTVP
jgi:hypothetical protein